MKTTNAADLLSEREADAILDELKSGDLTNFSRLIIDTQNHHLDNASVISTRAQVVRSVDVKTVGGFHIKATFAALNRDREEWLLNISEIEEDLVPNYGFRTYGLLYLQNNREDPALEWGDLLEQSHALGYTLATRAIFKNKMSRSRLPVFLQRVMSYVFWKYLAVIDMVRWYKNPKDKRLPQSFIKRVLSK